MEVQVRQAEADVACEIFYKQCEYLQSLHLNVFDQDVRMGRHSEASHDLVACSCSFPGLVSVELEVQQASRLQAAKTSALQKFQSLGPDSPFKRLLVLCVRIRQTSTAPVYAGSDPFWQVTSVQAEMWDGVRWAKQDKLRETASRHPKVRKKLLVPQQVLDSLDWFKVVGQRRHFAKISDFAKKVGYKSARDLKTQVATWNDLLRTKKVKGRLSKKRLVRTPGKATQGSMPWMGNRSVLRSLIRLL